MSICHWGIQDHLHSLWRERLSIMKMLFMFRAQANWIIFVKGIKGSSFPTGIQLIFCSLGRKRKKNYFVEWRNIGRITKRSHCCSHSWNWGFPGPLAMLKTWIWSSAVNKTNETSRKTSSFTTEMEASFLLKKKKKKG